MNPVKYSYYCACILHEVDIINKISAFPISELGKG